MLHLPMPRKPRDGGSSSAIATKLRQVQPESALFGHR
jgi:hypothetical protein